MRQVEAVLDVTAGGNEEAIARLPITGHAPSARLSLPRDSVQRRALALADAVAATATLLVLSRVGGAPLRPVSILLLPIAIVISKLVGLYDRDAAALRSTTLDEVPSVALLALLFALQVWLAAGSILVGDEVNKSQFAVVFATMAAVTLAGRVLARHVAGSLTERERCLVIGDPACFERVRKRLKVGHHQPANVVLGINVAPGGFGSLLEQGTLREVVDAYRIQRVVIASSGHDTEEVLELIRQASGLHAKVSVLPHFWETLGTLVVDEMPGTAMLAVRRFGLSRSSQFVKRGFDIVVAGVTVIVLAPLMLVFAALVGRSSSGPILFRQTRVGRNGRPFQMLKFRSMVCDAEARKSELTALNEADGLFKIRNDPRVTRVGHWLRETNLDELPQLFNVLKGEMSLVGPRPLIVEEDATIVGWRRRRLEVPPGMTGHWQVLGGARVPLDEMVVIDYLYIANWSLWRDVKCLLRTAGCVFARRGL